MVPVRGSVRSEIKRAGAASHWMPGKHKRNVSALSGDGTHVFPDAHDGGGPDEHGPESVVIPARHRGFQRYQMCLLSCLGTPGQLQARALGSTWDRSPETNKYIAGIIKSIARTL